MRTAAATGPHAYRPVQTADVLAWHHVQEARRQFDGRPPRLDFQELLRDQNDRYRVVHTRREMFDDEEFMTQFRDFIAPVPRLRRAGEG
jgi:hypothetical protein